MARKAAYQKNRRNKTGKLLIITVVLLMLVVVAVKSVELREKRAMYTAKEEALMQEIETEEARAEEITEFEKYTQTKKYVEEIAKEKLGLVYEGEIIFKDGN